VNNQSWAKKDAVMTSPEVPDNMPFESANLYRLLVDSLPDTAVFVFDTNLRYISADGNFLRRLGYDPEFLVGKTIYEVLGPESTNFLLPYYQAALGGEHVTFDGYARNHHFRADAIPVRDAQGRVVAGMISAYNTTDQKMMEAKLRESEARYRLLFDNSPNGIILTNEENKLLFVNTAACQMFGGTAEQLLQAGHLGLINMDTPAAQTMFHESHEMSDYSGELPCRRLDGTTFPAEVTTRGYFGDDGIHHTVTIIRDITARKRAEAQAIEMELAGQRMEMLNNFIHDVTHDFRTPLAVINSCAFLLSAQSTSPKRKDYEAQIRQQVDRLGEMVDSMVMLVKLNNAPKLEYSPMALDRHVQGVVDERRPTIEEASLHLDVELGASDATMTANIDLIERAVLSLIKNAIQYSREDGTITVRTRAENNQAVIEVQDNGSGIIPEDLPRIFDPMYKSDKARSSRSGGSGLGLAITKRIVELHHGSIEVESIHGQGSLFRIALPLST
jgi:PAS domain S-box-containing protein